MATMYRGFSTVGRVRKFRLTDFELIKQDLINHFYIRKGEKLMNPEFGTIIWNVIHEPFTEELKSIISADVKTIATYDPRISIDNIIVREYETGIQIELNLRNLQTNQTNLMNLRFDNQSKTLTAS
jgi:phage baseplate assembly protein W